MTCPAPRNAAFGRRFLFDFAPNLILLLTTLAWLAAFCYRGGLESFTLFIAVELLLLILILRLNLARAVETAGSVVSSLTLILAAWLMWIVLSPALSILPAVSFEVALVIAAFPLTYFIERFSSSGNQPLSLEYPLKIVATIVVALALVEFLAMKERPFSTFEDANALAALFNALFFPLYLKLLAKGHQTSRWQVAAAAALIVAVAFSTSLGGQICFLVGLTLATLVGGVCKRRSWTYLVMVLAVLAPSYLFANTYAPNHDALARLSDSRLDSPFTERLAMSRSALKMYGDNPWHGIGIGMYKILYPKYRSEKDRSTTGDLAHDDYVQFLTEGGPLLLGGLIVVAGWTLYRMWMLLDRGLHCSKRLIGEDDAARLQTAGYAIGALCLFLHAAMNFIFYVMALGMIAGLYLARIEAFFPVRRRPAPILRTRIPVICTSALAFIVVGTLGLRGIFLELSQPTGCQLHFCRELRNEETPVANIASLIAATQPTWLPARDYLVKRAMGIAELEPDPVRKHFAHTVARDELLKMIRDAPLLSYPYAQLADLISTDPSLASGLLRPVPLDAASLYRAALERFPQDQTTRLKLARLMEKAGDREEAFLLVQQGGMKWWRTAAVTDIDRIAMLQYLLPRAVELGMCDEARSIASGLIIYLPQSPSAMTALAGIRASAPDRAGCGLVESLPMT